MAIFFAAPKWLYFCFVREDTDFVVVWQGRLVGVPVPGNVWTTPGHYNVVGLLPEDNTFAKGSLFILERGSKCVVFDMDGTLVASHLTLTKLLIVHG